MKEVILAGGLGKRLHPLTQVNNQYIKWGDMSHKVLSGWWADAGTIESLFHAAELVSHSAKNREHTTLEQLEKAVKPD